MTVQPPLSLGCHRCRTLPLYTPGYAPTANALESAKSVSWLLPAQRRGPARGLLGAPSSASSLRNYQARHYAQAWKTSRGTAQNSSHLS